MGSVMMLFCTLKPPLECVTLDGRCLKAYRFLGGSGVCFGAFFFRDSPFFLCLVIWELC